MTKYCLNLGFEDWQVLNILPKREEILQDLQAVIFKTKLYLLH